MHSRETADVQRGIELAEALTDSGGLEQRDLLYLVAVRRWGVWYVLPSVWLMLMVASSWQRR